MLKLLVYLTGMILLLHCTITAKSYNGAELYSKSSLKYGRFDVRMRAVSGSGIVSSFFLYYDESYLGSPEPWVEIDIEILGKDKDVFQSNIITGNAASKQTSEQLHDFNDLSTSYHTYSVEWTPDYIAWYFDGAEVRRTTGSQATACQQKDMSYRFNLWISDVPAWVGQFNPSILPVYQFINWMQYSRYTPGSGTDGSDFTFDWKDDFDTFNSSRWGKGDWTFDGNLVDFSPNNIVVKDGYCIICLTNANATGFSGTVPKDLSTSMVNGYRDAGPRIFNSAGSEPASSFAVTLDGRLISGNVLNQNRLNTMVHIMKTDNSVIRRITLSE